MPPRGTKLTTEEAKNANIDRATLGRAWRFAKPYHRMILAFLATMAGSSLVAIGPPLVFKRLIDTGIPERDFGHINLLVLLAVGLALGETALRLGNRYLSSRIGEGLIYDMRTELYDHVQRMPIAFFTRTQTGQLMSRLNTDVVGAQGTVTTLATVTSNVFLLTATVTAMLFLNWQVTACALLIVPGIVVVDRVLSPRMVSMSRERMQLNGDMGATMTERFNVSGALLVKLFGRRRHEVEQFSNKARAVRDTGIRLAMTSRLYYASLTLMGALGRPASTGSVHAPSSAARSRSAGSSRWRPTSPGSTHRSPISPEPGSSCSRRSSRSSGASRCWTPRTTSPRRPMRSRWRRRCAVPSPSRTSGSATRRERTCRSRRWRPRDRC